MNEFSQSIDFLSVYEIYYFDIIVEKKYIILIAHNSRLLFYYANRSHRNLRQNHTQRQITPRRSIAEKNTSKACPIVRQTCQKSSVIKLSTVFSSKMHWKRVRVVPVRYNGDSFHWFWQPWVTPLLLGLPLVPAKLLLRLKFPAMNPAPKT